MLRESSKAWSNGSEAYSSDPDEEEEEDMVFGESDQAGIAEEMMDLSDLPTALFACSVHEAVFEQDTHRVRRCKLTSWVVCLQCVCVSMCISLFTFESSRSVCATVQDLRRSSKVPVSFTALAPVCESPVILTLCC